MPLVSTDEGVGVDRDAEASTADKRSGAIMGRVVHAFGSFPGNAWLISLRVGSAEMHAYRWKERGWAPYAEWHAWSPSVPVAMGSEPAGLLSAPAELPPDKDGATTEYGLGVLAPHTGHVTPFAIRTVTAKKLGPYDYTPVIAMANDKDSLYVLATRGPKLVVERRGGSKGAGEDVSVVTDLGTTDGLIVHANLFVGGAEGPILYGSLARLPTPGRALREEPLFFKSKNHVWEASELPAGQSRVAAYDAGSAERIFTYEADSPSLFERPLSGGAWQSIPLPALPPGDTIDHVWLANDDAWLLVTPKDSHTNPPHLMRMKPVKEVWRVQE